MAPSEDFNAAASYLSNASSLSSVSNAIKLELYGLFKFVTVSHTPNTSRPGLLDFAGRAKWDSWQQIGKKYSTQPDPDGAAQTQYIEIAKSLGWKPETTTGGGLLDQDKDGEGGSAKGVVTGTGVSVSTISAPKDDNGGDSDTIHGLAIAGDSQKLEEIIKASPSLDLNQKDGFGYTALHLACDRGKLEIVRVLLKHGADQTVKDADGLTALELAKTCGHDQIVSALNDGQ